MTRPAYPISLLLILSTYLVYQQTLGHPFIEYDTSEYIANNRYVRAGLTIEGVKWAFFSSYFANWHPITWLSHMLDVEFYGLSAGLHHLTNLLLHISNSLLLFFFLIKSTKKPLASWLVAGIFALHPLHVESVAWIAERKDVLSCFFGLLSLTSYAHYTKTKNRWPYFMALLFFALGLMAKPMLVTLPALFIVLDYWPLNRLLDATSPSCRFQVIFRKIFLLFLEKIPFFVLAVISCTITLQVQNIEHNIPSLTSLPLDMRFADATTSYVKYIIKAFWPLHLAILYPAQHHTETWNLLLSLIGLTGISTTAFLFRYSRPWLLTGWLWYIGTLLPVIGFIPIGEHDIADRYTYIPLIGLAIMFAYSIDDKVSSAKQKNNFAFSLQ